MIAECHEARACKSCRQPTVNLSRVCGRCLERRARWAGRFAPNRNERVPLTPERLARLEAHAARIQADLARMGERPECCTGCRVELFVGENGLGCMPCTQKRAQARAIRHCDRCQRPIPAVDSASRAMRRRYCSLACSRQQKIATPLKLHLHASATQAERPVRREARA